MEDGTRGQNHAPLTACLEAAHDRRCGRACNAKDTDVGDVILAERHALSLDLLQREARPGGRSCKLTRRTECTHLRMLRSRLALNS